MAQYENIDMSSLDADMNSLVKGKNDNEDILKKYVRMPQGEGFVRLRIMPKTQKTGDWYCATRLHNLRSGTGRKAYHCTRNRVLKNGRYVWEGDCIICKYYSMIWQMSESDGVSQKEKETLQAEARSIKPQERFYFNAIVRQEINPTTGETLTNVGPKIYSAPKQMYEKIVRSMKGDTMAGEMGLGDVTHPKTGRDLRVVKKIEKVHNARGGTDEYPNYNLSKFEDTSPTGTAEEFSNWLENLHDLQSLRVLKSKDELKQALHVHRGEHTAVPENDDLAEFRQNKIAEVKVASKASETLREDFVVSKPASQTSSANYEEENLADDEFMAELTNM